MSNDVQRVLRPPKGSFFLFGPRGTGKSTWLRRTWPGACYVDLLDERRYQSYLADPGLFGDELRAVRRGGRVIVDEVQRLPNLLNEVHRHMEERKLIFVLCGSSARKLKQAGVNLLAGRAVRRFLHPFVPEELGDAFDLEETLHWGSLPVVWDSTDRRDTLLAYTEMYLREEVQAEALVRNLAGFARFLPVAALFHGQVLNIAGLARDAGVSRTTVDGYLGVLEDTLLAYRLPAYPGKLRVRERRHPKLYWADPGLPRALKRQFGKPGPEERGHLFEGWVAGVLRAYRDYHATFDEWWYWAPAGAGQTEVDFLLRKGEHYTAIEVKSGKAGSAEPLRGLRAIEGLPGLSRRVLVHLGDVRRRTSDGIDILSVPDFLEMLRGG